jgi:hypothetical protein
MPGASEAALEECCRLLEKFKVQAASADKRLHENPIKGHRIVDKDAGNIEARSHRSPAG